MFSGAADVDEIAERLHVPIEREGFETVGGFLLSHLGHVPAIGETFDIDGLHVEVIDAERRRVRKVRITRASRRRRRAATRANEPRAGDQHASGEAAEGPRD